MQAGQLRDSALFKRLEISCYAARFIADKPHARVFWSLCKYVFTFRENILMYISILFRKAKLTSKVLRFLCKTTKRDVWLFCVHCIVLLSKTNLECARQVSNATLRSRVLGTPFRLKAKQGVGLRYLHAKGSSETRRFRAPRVSEFIDSCVKQLHSPQDVELFYVHLDCFASQNYSMSGEGEIRTHDPLRDTAFQVRRNKPGYPTSPGFKFSVRVYA